jgi:methyl-accepting chemotaxis protein
VRRVFVVTVLALGPLLAALATVAVHAPFALTLALGGVAAAATVAAAAGAVHVTERLIATTRYAEDFLETIVEGLGSFQREVSASTAEQSAAVAETTATVQELATTAGSIADNAATVAAAAERTVETMQEMHTTVDAIAQRSHSLGERSKAIDEILGLIIDIGAQTNLLALNAAIEAARAGEAGKGFAVVASEVRKLAERSIGSTDSIRELVHAIQAETTATVLATEQGTRQAHAVSALMDETASMLDQSTLATQQQQSAAGQVSTAMDHIRTGAEGIAAQITQMNNDPQLFQETADHMSQALAACGVDELPPPPGAKA